MAEVGRVEQGEGSLNLWGEIGRFAAAWSRKVLVFSEARSRAGIEDEREADNSRELGQNPSRQPAHWGQRPQWAGWRMG